jgi:hypothetical protein
MSTINYKLDLSRYNLVELEVFLDTGIITVDEFENEKEARKLYYDIITPTNSRYED